MSFTNQDFKISMKGIGQVNRNILENYISNLDKNELSVILYYPSFLYFFFFFLNRKVHLSQNIINYFFQKQTNEQLRRYIQKLNRRMKYISTLKKEELQNIFIYEAKSICQLDNMFLQDIFDPSLIFKSKSALDGPHPPDIYSSIGTSSDSQRLIILSIHFQDASISSRLTNNDGLPLITSNNNLS